MRTDSIVLSAAIMIFLAGDVTAQGKPGTDRDQSNNPGRLEGKQQRQKKSGKRESRSSRQSRFNPERLFQRFDQDRDGMLTSDEIPERLQQRMSDLDMDGDSAISKREFVAAFRNRMKNAQGGRPGGNKDRSGQGMSAEMMLNRLDKDSDGRVSLEEAPERMKDKFERVDSSGDGFIDARELTSLVERMKGSDKNGRYNTDPEKTRGQLPKRPPGGVPNS